MQSIQKQTYRNCETIVINDGSEDGTLDVCKRIAKTCKLKLFTVSHCGPASARNIGLNNASGEFVFFLDADDYLPADSIKVLLNQVKKEKADIAIGSFTRVNYRKNQKEKIRNLLHERDVLGACQYCPGRSLSDPQISPAIQVKSALPYPRAGQPRIEADHSNKISV